MKFCSVSKWMLTAAIFVNATGCGASKEFVRNRVQESNDQLSAQIEKMDANAKGVASNVADLSDQVRDVTRITRENTIQVKDTSNQLQIAKNDFRAVDDKAVIALKSVESARAEIGETGRRVEELQNQLVNRKYAGSDLGIAGEGSVRFEFNSAQLQPQFHSVLDTLAEKVKQDPDAVIVLEGRTDSVGTPDYNVRLGQQRLDAVLRYLTIQSEVPIQKIFQISMGKENPLADNSTREGREQNRATVVRVLSPHSSGAVASKSTN